MPENPIVIASALMGMLSGLSGALIAIFKRGSKEGLDQATVANLTFQIGTVKSQSDTLMLGLAEVQKALSKQEEINAQSTRNGILREERENRMESRVSNMEGRMGR